MAHRHHTTLLFAALVLLLFACGKHLSKDKSKASTLPANNITQATMDQPASAHLNGDYLEEWKIIDSLQAQGLFKSALERVTALQARAQGDKNGQQVVKTLIFRGKFMTMLEEDGLIKAIQLLETETNAAAQPEKSVLKSILGELYTTYLQNNGWNLGNRTPIPEGEGGDILTWSADQVERHALDLYAASLTEVALLKNTPVEKFRDISEAGQNDTVQSPLRPTLYDFLAHRALTHFTNERAYLNQPAFAFVLDQENAFAPAVTFVKTKIETKDSTSGKWLAISLFQKVLATHLEDKEPSALIDADLLRLQFAHSNAVSDNKGELYLRALENLHRQYSTHPSDAEILYHLANQRVASEVGDKASNAKTAVAECEDAIRRHPNSYGAGLCRQLLQSIKAPSLLTTVEEVSLPQKPILVALELKNIGEVWVRVVRASSSLEEWSQDRLSELKSRPALQPRSWKISTPTDYQSHRTEIALEPLPLGQYWVLVANNADFDPKKGPVTFTNFNCSNIAPLSLQEGKMQSSKRGPLFIIAHRQSGVPLQNVKLECFQRNYQSGRMQLQLITTTETDENGMAKPSLPEGIFTEVRASMGEDSLWIGGAGNYRNYYGENTRPKAHFFTDRAIYRPGQTIYFKGILYRQDKPSDQPSIAANRGVNLKFYDANGQEKARLSLRSNDFGTFNGTFTAPSTGLTGSMSIRADEAEGQASFNVEEYKRPKFEVTLKPLEGAYRLGAKVTVKGEAKAYAGSNVDGALVRYRVVRQARFPYWDYFGWWRRPPAYSSESQEIAQGEAKTDTNGGFEVPFELLPDRSVPKKDQPVFDYTVSVDVVDISGETRSAENTVSAGYTALQVDWNLSAEMTLDSLKRVVVKTSNMAGQKQAAEGRITLTKLTASKFYIARYWEKPDLFTIPQADFQRLFPDLAWKDEDDPKQWARQDFDRPVAFNTANAAPIDLNGGRMQTGWYEIKLSTKDAFGETVERTQVLRVWDEKSEGGRFVQPDANVEKRVLEPGATARFWLGGQAANLHAFFAREKDGALENPRWLRINGAEKIELPVTEQDRGNIIAHWFAVRDNRIYGGAPLIVVVPWSNKELQISFETFRDKLAPGQKEEWRLKISGAKKEKVAAEMVAAMYDASLDQFLPHGWSGLAYPEYYPAINFYERRTYGAQGGETRYDPDTNDPSLMRRYRALNWFDFPLYGGRQVRYMKAMADRAMPAAAPGGAVEMQLESAQVMAQDASGKMMKDEGVRENYRRPEVYDALDKKQGGGTFPASIRRNLQETVFFFPELRTDAQGNLILKFTMNEALTRWKLLTYAHTKDLQQSLAVKEVVTQKELMVLPNPPRFLREGDVMEFSAKVSNLSQESTSGTATLSLLDAETLQPVEAKFGLTNRSVPFSAATGQSAAVAWKIQVPEGYAGAVTWQVFAEGKRARDGEENTLPVVSNRMLVTETLPITLRGKQTKTFVFDNFKNGAKAGDKSSLKTHQYTLEFSSNPAWYAVQALPYLMEFPHECSEQVFSRFYANTLAQSATEKMPNIRRIYDRWKGTDALKSNLSKNQELKYALLEETPWVMDAQNEAQQKQNIALLFDLNRMADERERAIATLAERQYDGGGWPWFPGGREDWYITQHILTGFAHLDKLGAFSKQNDPKVARMLDKALGFCARKLAERYEELNKLAQAGKLKMEDDHLESMAVQYLYARSFFLKGQEDNKPDKVTAYYLDQAAKYWLGKGLYQEGLIALAMYRFGRPETAQKIVASLKERATVKEELGMYWPFDWGFYWYQLPIETQALMVEVFSEVAKDPAAVENLRIWLLKNKQTNRWESTKATAEAVYALLLNGDNWLANTKPVQVSLGGRTLKPAEYEAGTGYFKQQWGASEVKPSWSEIKVENPNSNIVWGAAYWQYFEDLDKIRDFQKTPLTIVKQLFKEENTATGPVLSAVKEGQSLKPGDKIKVRIEIRVDRQMEYVHLKDLRAAGLEPVNVLSGYRWQGGLGYYESTKDLATHFFIDYLPKGTFVFEYPLVVSLKGDFSNGITTMQCMYAPEFTSHSKGVRVRVE